MSNNPRKFSEKIALHNQKQAEGTAEFEKVLQEVFGAIMNANTQNRPNPNIEVNQTQNDLENDKNKLQQMPQKQINIQSQNVSNINPQFQNLSVQNNTHQIFNEGCGSQNNLAINQQNNLLDLKNDIELKKSDGKMINFKGVDLNSRQFSNQNFAYQKTQYKLNNNSSFLNMTSNYIPLQTTRSQINLHNNLNNHLEIKDHFITKNNHYSLHSNRISYSPYHLTPPNLDTNWRRTNSDSALHQSTSFIEQRNQNQIQIQIQNDQHLFDIQQQNIYDAQQNHKIVIQQQNANKVNEEKILNNSNSIANNNNIFKNNLQILKNINNLSTWDPGKQNNNVHQQNSNQAHCKIKTEKLNTSFVTNPVISINYSNPSQNSFTSLDNSNVNSQNVFTSSIINNNQENIFCDKMEKPINTDQLVIENDCTNYQFSSLQSQNNSLNHMSQSNNQSFNSSNNIYQNSILSTNSNGFNTINTSTNHGFLYANNNVSSVSLPDLTSFNCQDMPSLPLEKDDYINNSLNSNDNSNNSNHSALSNGSYQLTNDPIKSNNYKKNEVNNFMNSSFSSSLNYSKNNGNTIQNHSNSNSPSHHNTMVYGSLPNHHQMSNSTNFNIDNLQKSNPQLISQLNNQQVSSAFRSSSIESKEDTISLIDQIQNDETMVDDFDNDLIQQIDYDFSNNETRNTKYINNDANYDKNIKFTNNYQNGIQNNNKNFYNSFYHDSNQLMNHRNVSTPSENASTAPNSPASSINNLNSPVNSPQEVNNNCPTSNQINLICKNSLANMTINNDSTINEDFLELDNFGSEEYELAKSSDSSYQYLPFKYVNENINGFNGEIMNNQNKDVTILNYNLLNSTPLPTITLTEHNPDISNSNEFSH